MQELVEGRMTFSFPEPLNAQKYDDWSFYRNQMTNAFGGAKAVDFICLEKQCGWLIEVKDYRFDRRTKPGDLGEEVSSKVRDTLAGLVAASCNANDENERRFAADFLKKNKLRVVLHIEQPRNNTKLFPRIVNPADMVLKLKQLLKPVDAHPVVVDQNSLKADMRWNVEG